MSVASRGGNLEYLIQLRTGLRWYIDAARGTGVNDLEMHEALADELTRLIAYVRYGGPYKRKPTRCAMIDLTAYKRSDNTQTFADEIGVKRPTIDYAFRMGTEAGLRSSAIGMHVVGFFDGIAQEWVFNFSPEHSIRLRNEMIPAFGGVASLADLRLKLGERVLREHAPRQ